MESKDLIIEIISSPLKFIVFNLLSVFTEKGGSVLEFSKGVHCDAKKSLNKLALSATFDIVLANSGRIDEILILF